MKITISGAELKTMEAFDYVCWKTPGSNRHYVAANASFRDDYVIATPQDFLEAAGLDFSDGIGDDEEFWFEL